MLNPSNQFHNIDAYGKTEAANQRSFGELIKSKLMASGYSKSLNVVITADDTTDNLQWVCSQEKQFAPHIFLALHGNAGGGTGTECFYASGDNFGKRVATRLCTDVSSLLGIQNRGAKSEAESAEGGIYVIENTSSTALLIESYFHDNKSDCDKFASNRDKVANQIAYILLDECQKQFGVLQKDDPIMSPAKQQALSYISNVEKSLNEFKGVVSKWQ